jgi:hypothetical protein
VHVESTTTAQAPPYHVATLGRGLGSYRLGMARRVWPGLIRSTHRLDDGIELRTDYYRDLRLVWYYGGRLMDIATTRPGDRSSVGLVVGRSTLKATRAKYPKAPTKWRGAWLPEPLGTSAVAIVRTAPGDLVFALYYWFDVSGKLIGIEVFQT